MLEDGAQADEELVRMACHGSPAERRSAFELLVTRYEGFVRAMLTRLCGNRETADDIAQETFLDAWLKLDTLRMPAAFRGWLRQMAYRRFLHDYRHAQVERNHRQSVSADAEHPSLQLQTADDLAPLLSLCTPLEQELMVLCYGFEFTYAEIASARDMAVGTVKSHVHRAKVKMQAHLEREQDINRGDGHG